MLNSASELETAPSSCWEEDSAPCAPVPDLETVRIGVLGLGYVGLPLVAAFARKWSTTGFDISDTRVTELAAGYDRTMEVDGDSLLRLRRLRLTAREADLERCNVYIVTVPTPVDRFKRPDLSMLKNASRTVGMLLKRGDVAVYESTVYPGATEEVCLPILERESGLKCSQDFHLGYSPERINPGDQTHNLATIRKVVSATSPAATDFLAQLYGRIVTAGTYQASGIRVAEAAKVIENTQRDVNIALINELAMLFNQLGISTQEVLATAGTKWNFLPFKPGLVGGHCIGVDPYYLTQKAQEIGYFPEMILAGRRINDGMGQYVVSHVIRLAIQRGIRIHGGRLLVLGATFKENCPDMRNSQVLPMVRSFLDYGMEIELFDPLINSPMLPSDSRLKLVSSLESSELYDIVIMAVPHKQFLRTPTLERLRKLTREGGLFYDIKGVLPDDFAAVKL